MMTTIYITKEQQMWFDDHPEIVMSVVCRLAIEEFINRYDKK